MDEITMYTALRPEAPGNAGEIFPFPAGGSPDQGYAVTIRPSAIPEGDSILIQLTWSPLRPIFGMDVGDMVMSTTKPPACTPARGA